MNMSVSIKNKLYTVAMVTLSLGMVLLTGCDVLGVGSIDPEVLGNVAIVSGVPTQGSDETEVPAGAPSEDTDNADEADTPPGEDADDTDTPGQDAEAPPGEDAGDIETPGQDADDDEAEAPAEDASDDEADTPPGEDADDAEAEAPAEDADDTEAPGQDAEEAETPPGEDADDAEAPNEDSDNADEAETPTEDASDDQAEAPAEDADDTDEADTPDENSDDEAEAPTEDGGNAGALSTDPANPTLWNARQVYARQGYYVSHDGKTYESQWWVQGNEPGAAEWNGWREVNSDGSYVVYLRPGQSNISDWSETTAYPGADYYVRYNGVAYRSKWYANAGETPGVAAVWERVE